MMLRQPTNAQYEIRIYADSVHDMLSEIYPRTMELYDEEYKQCFLQPQSQ